MRRGKKSQMASGVWLRDLESFGALIEMGVEGKGLVWG